MTVLHRRAEFRSRAWMRGRRYGLRYWRFLLLVVGSICVSTPTVLAESSAPWLAALTEHDKEVINRTTSRLVDASRLSMALPAKRLPADAYALIEFDLHADGSVRNPRLRATNLDESADAAFIEKCLSAMNVVRFSKVPSPSASNQVEQGLFVLRFETPAGWRRE